MPSAVQYGQLMGNWALQSAGQPQLCYQYDAATQPELATSPVQSDPVMAAQSLQILNRQLLYQRALLQALLQQANYYQHTPLQQTGLYEAQQTGSSLQLPKQRKPKTPGGGTSEGSSFHRRRVRCRKCAPCTRKDCLKCQFCRDRKKYGGRQHLKKPCIRRKCLAVCLSVCLCTEFVPCSFCSHHRGLVV